MKQSYLALFLLLTLGIFSCRKDRNDIDIYQYDQNQIEAYINTNRFTNMVRDKEGGVDTTGIYYEILSKGTGQALNYDTRSTVVLSVKSLDGEYSVTDTISSHNYGFVGNVQPNGLMLALVRLAKNKGTRAHFVIPSRLAYGASGVGTGSTRLRGNQSLDYYVNVLDDTKQIQYDVLSIQKYAQANGINLSTYTHNATTGLYYKVTTPGTGAVPITAASTFNVQYTGTLLNNNIFDQFNDQDTGNTGIAFTLDNTIEGWKNAFPGATAGAKLSLFVPSGLGYGTQPQINQQTNITTIPSSSCLRFEVNVVSVTN
jgi:FKBP-type peptidyl-prolyl cis-trans isomerase FkpA